MDNKPSIRRDIDTADIKLLDALAERWVSVGKVKTDKIANWDEFRDLNREADVIASRREWATERNLDPDMAEELFRTVMKFSVAFQREE